MTKHFEPVGCQVDLSTGAMTNRTGGYRKRFRDLEGLYADSAAFEAIRKEFGDDDLVYEVSEFRPDAAAGDLIFGTTRMSPGVVGDEFFMTRGHIHKQADRPEIYYGQAGVGLMLMESPEGEVRMVEIGPQTCCYVPPFWIHRSINIGKEDLVMLFCYPADSGQDYEVIARSGGMRSRILQGGSDGAAWKEVPNPVWAPRDTDALAAIYAGTSKEGHWDEMAKRAREAGAREQDIREAAK